MHSTYYFAFFFLLIQRHPRSTLFPYTTLFRSGRPDPSSAARPYPARRRRCPSSRPPTRCVSGARKRPRSEEHTSELQSLTNLVCRLLLEKKKKKQHNHTRVFERHRENIQGIKI